jgi:hypothetical protein
MLELIATHKNILAQLNIEAKKELMQIIIDKKDLKGQNLVWYGSFGIQTSCLAVIKLLEFENKTESFNQELIYPYVLNGILSTEEIITEINYYALSFINE